MKRRMLLALLVLAMPSANAGEFDALFQKHGAAHSVDWRLLKAIGTVESHLNPRAENPDGLSAGIMQIHCAPAHGAVCTNRFDIAAWPPATRAQLYAPDYNIGLGAEIIAWNIRHYGLKKGIACYNAWSVCRNRRTEPFSNQPYLEKVLRAYSALKIVPAAGVRNSGSVGRLPARTPPVDDRAVSPALRALNKD